MLSSQQYVSNRKKCTSQNSHNYIQEIHSYDIKTIFIRKCQHIVLGNILLSNTLYISGLDLKIVKSLEEYLIQSG